MSQQRKMKTLHACPPRVAQSELASQSEVDCRNDSFPGAVIVPIFPGRAAKEWNRKRLSQEYFTLGPFPRLPVVLRVALCAGRLLVVMQAASTDAGQAGPGQAVIKCRELLASVNSAAGICEASGLPPTGLFGRENRALTSKLFQVGVFTFTNGPRLFSYPG